MRVRVWVCAEGLRDFWAGRKQPPSPGGRNLHVKKEPQRGGLTLGAKGFSREDERKLHEARAMKFRCAGTTIVTSTHLGTHPRKWPNHFLSHFQSNLGHYLSGAEEMEAGCWRGTRATHGKFPLPAPPLPAELSTALEVLLQKSWEFLPSLAIVNILIRQNHILV